MKKMMISSVAAILLTAVAYSQQAMTRLNDDQVLQTELRQAISLGEKLLLGQRSGEIYILSEDEAIPQVAKGLSEGVQTASYENIRSMFGDYVSMQFAEAWSMQADQAYTVYRFKGTFDGTDEKPEIRIILNREGKLSGFWIRPWQEELGGQP